MADIEPIFEDESTTGPRVWVGCLACYNGGALVGAWVDAVDAPEYVPPRHRSDVCLSCGETVAPDRLDGERCVGGWEGREGHYRGITGPDGSPHEEQWVMDHEGFEGLLDGECSPMRARELGELYAELEDAGHPVGAYAAYAATVGGDYADVDGFEESYRGEHDSEESYAEELAEELGLVPDEFKWPTSYINWTRAARDLFIESCWSHEIPGEAGRVWVFDR